VIHDPSASGLELAYDGDAATFCALSENTEGQVAAVTWDDFPDGAIPANKRESVIARVKCGWTTTDTNDKISVYARAVDGDPWSLMAYAKYPNTFSPAAYVDVDVTDVIGQEPMSSLDIQVVFGNGATGDPDNPDPPIPHGV